MAKTSSIRRKDVGAKIESAIEALLFDNDSASTHALASAASALLREMVTNAGGEPFAVAIDPCIRRDTAEFELLGSIRDYATIFKPTSHSEILWHTTFPMRLFVAYLMRLYPNALLEPFREHIAPGRFLPDLQGPDPKAAAGNCLRQYLDSRSNHPPIPPAMAL
jgi:hypothetical protein